MGLSMRELNRATLARQLLLGREALPVPDAVRRIVAVQAQEPASPYIALWNRLRGFDPAELDAAFGSAQVVKATTMRITLHAVHAADYPRFHQAMQPSLRASRLYDKRFVPSGLTAAEAEELIGDLLSFASQPRSNAEMEAWFAGQIGGSAKAAWWALRTFTPVRHAATGGPWTFGTRPSYVAAGIPASRGDLDVSDDALSVLARRYLEGFGPATAADLARFALVQMPRARGALAAIAGSLEELQGPDGVTLYDVPGGLRPPADIPAPPRLMAMWDSVLLAHAERGRLIPEQYRKALTRSNGDVLPALLVDGTVAGVWRTAGPGIEATAFRPLPRADWDGLAAEAAGLLELLGGRDPRPYRRFDRWWDDLPAHEVRMLA
jgi:hypothetical protein